jgi:hypothetical protein
MREKWGKVISPLLLEPARAQSVQVRSGQICRRCDRYLNDLVGTIQSRKPIGTPPEMNPERWPREGFDLRDFLYDVKGEGTGRKPATVPDAYAVVARSVAYERLALAGYRLAECLNARLLQ